MQAPPSRVLVAAFLALAALYPALTTRAQTRVVVESFRGPQAGRIRGHMVAALSAEESIEVVPRSEVQAAAAELGLRAGRLSADDYPQIARELNVAAFVRGRVSRRRRRWSVTAVVRNGADGAELGRSSWGGRTVSSLGAIRRSGYRRLAPFFAAAESPGAPAEDPTPAEGNQWWNSGGEVDEEAPADEEEEEDSEPIDPGSRYDFFTFELLGGFLYRSMTASATVLNNGREPTLPADTELQEIRSYNSAGLGHGELGFRLGFFPGAIPANQPFPWFGLLFEMRHSVGVTSRGCPEVGACGSDAERIDVGTNQFEIYVGAVGRYRFGEERGAPTLWAEVGYGLFGFILDTDALMQLRRRDVLPPIQYSFVHLGGGIDYAIVPVYFTAGARLAYRVGLDVGDDARAIWGGETGGSSGFELGIDLKTEMPYIAEGVFVGLSFEYFVFTTTWRGQARCLEMPCTDDADAWERWPYERGPPAMFENVTGGIQNAVNDNYIRLFLSVGYAFR